MSQRRAKKNKELDMTVNSSIFASIGPAATSSPNGKNEFSTLQEDSFKNSVWKSLDDHDIKECARLDASSLSLMASIRRKIKILTFEFCSVQKNEIIEYWTLEGSSKAEEQRKQQVQCQATRDKEQQVPLVSVPSNTSNDVSGEIQKNYKKRQSSSAPSSARKNESDDENEVFKRPTGKVRASRKRAPSADRFKTPMNKMLLRRNIATVTPGPDINKPLTIMRRPKPGEMAISLSGSPLLVSTDSTTTEMPYVNVPVDSEKVISIFPRSGFSRDDVPSVDHNTKQKLRLLREYLDEMCD